MLSYATAWIVTALAFLGLDAIWLSNMWPRLYKPLVGEITRAQLNFTAASVFYVVYVSAIVFLAVAPALEKASLSKAVINGAVFGFAAYATYNLTNQATLKAWDWRVTFADMAWGTIATATAAGIAYVAASRVN